MTSLDLFRFALRNITAQRLRSLLTGGAIAIGGLLIFLLPSLGLGVTRELRSELLTQEAARTITVMPKYESIPLDFSAEFTPPKVEKRITREDLASFEQLSNLTGIRDVYFDLQPDSLYVEATGKQVRTVKQPVPSYNVEMSGGVTGVALETHYLPSNVTPEHRELTVTHGRYFSSDEQTAMVALVTPKFLTAVGLEDPEATIGKSLTLTFLRELAFNDLETYVPEAKTVKVTVIGVVESDDDAFAMPAVIIPTKVAYDIKAWQTEKITEFRDHFTFDSVTLMATTTEAAQDMATTLKGKNFEVRTAQDEIALFGTILRVAIGTLGSIGGIALLVGALAISNTMLMAVSERTKEIGILRALGAKQRTIVQLFLLESTVLAVLGGLVGVGIGVLISLGINAILQSRVADLGVTDGAFHLFDYSPLLFVSVVMFIAVIGLLAGILPAIRASRLNVVESLRYE